MPGSLHGGASLSQKLGKKMERGGQRGCDSLGGCGRQGWDPVKPAMSLGTAVATAQPSHHSHPGIPRDQPREAKRLKMNPNPTWLCQGRRASAPPVSRTQPPASTNHTVGTRCPLAGAGGGHRPGPELSPLLLGVPRDGSCKGDGAGLDTQGQEAGVTSWLWGRWPHGAGDGGPAATSLNPSHGPARRIRLPPWHKPPGKGFPSSTQVSGRAQGYPLGTEVCGRAGWVLPSGNVTTAQHRSGGGGHTTQAGLGVGGTLPAPGCSPSWVSPR